LNLQFNQNNSNIKAYLENLGANQQVTYQLQPNPWGNTSAGHDEAFANSRLRIKMNAQMPMALQADGLTLQDTFDIDLSQDLQKSHVSAATLILDATNAFPFSCDIVLYFMKDGQVWHTVIADAQLVSALQGQVDPSDGLLKKKNIYKLLNLNIHEYSFNQRQCSRLFLCCRRHFVCRICPRKFFSPQSFLGWGGYWSSTVDS